MASITDRQRKALGIFEFVLTLLNVVGQFFRSHHRQDLSTPSPEASSEPDFAPEEQEL